MRRKRAANDRTVLRGGRTPLKINHRCGPLVNLTAGRIGRSNRSIRSVGKRRTIRQFARHYHGRSLRSVSTANSSTLHHGAGIRNEITTAVNDIRYGRRWDRTNLITSRSASAVVPPPACTANSPSPFLSLFLLYLSCFQVHTTDAASDREWQRMT